MNKRTLESVKIRPVQLQDIPALSSFFQDLSDTAKQFFHPHPFDVETLHTIYSSKKDHYYILLGNNKIAGYSMLRFFGYNIPSFGCCIHPSFENRGYGTMLTKWTIDQARKQGYPKVILKTYKENKIAFTIYKKMGFTIVGETADHKQYQMELLL